MAADQFVVLALVDEAGDLVGEIISVGRHAEAVFHPPAGKTVTGVEAATLAASGRHTHLVGGPMSYVTTGAELRATPPPQGWGPYEEDEDAEA